MKCPKKAEGKLQIEGKLVVAWGWRWDQRLIVNGHEEFYQGDKNILKLDYGDGYTSC